MKGRKHAATPRGDARDAAFNEAGPVKGRKLGVAGRDAGRGGPFNEAGPVKGRKRLPVPDSGAEAPAPSMRPAL